MDRAAPIIKPRHVIRSRAPLFTAPAFDYTIDQLGGQSIGLCRPYRAVNLPFGFEVITDQTTRAEVLSRTFSLFERAPQRHVLVFDQTPDQLIAPAGSSAISLLTVYNLNAGVSDLHLTGRQRMVDFHHADFNNIKILRIARDHDHDANSARRFPRCRSTRNDHRAPDRFTRPRRINCLNGQSASQCIVSG